MKNLIILISITISWKFCQNNLHIKEKNNSDVILIKELQQNPILKKKINEKFPNFIYKQNMTEDKSDDFYFLELSAPNKSYFIIFINFFIFITFNFIIFVSYFLNFEKIENYAKTFHGIIFILSMILLLLTPKLFKFDINKDFFFINLIDQSFYKNFYFWTHLIGNGIYNYLNFKILSKIEDPKNSNFFDFIKKNKEFILVVLSINVLLMFILFSLNIHNSHNFIRVNNNKKIYKFDNNFLKVLEFCKNKNNDFIPFFPNEIAIISVQEYMRKTNPNLL
jgi:hypothetical protein